MLIVVLYMKHLFRVGQLTSWNEWHLRLQKTVVIYGWFVKWRLLEEMLQHQLPVNRWGILLMHLKLMYHKWLNYSLIV